MKLIITPTKMAAFPWTCAPNIRTGDEIQQLHWVAVMGRSHICRVTSVSCQSHLKFYGVEWELVMTWSSQKNYWVASSYWFAN